MTGRDLFSAVPVAACGTSLALLPDGGGVLSRRGEAPAGFGGWLVRSLRLERALRYQLDQVGACYWTHVNGERSLADIQTELCLRFELPSAEARRAIIQFTAALMSKNLLALRVEKP